MLVLFSKCLAQCLWQVRLETAPDSQHVQSPADFDMLKMSNALRYEVLTEILTSLGLSCELSQMPPPSPVHVFSTCPVQHTALFAPQSTCS